MNKVSVQWFEKSGLIIGQDVIEECVTVPELLKTNFYETLLTACLNGEYVSWTDLDGNRLLMNYEHRNHFNVFLNLMYIGDLPFIPLSETSIAIPIDTNDTEQLYEVYTSDDEMSDCYLLYQTELF